MEMPEGFIYQPNFLSTEEEKSLLQEIFNLKLSTVIFRGYQAKRKAVSYGVGYNFDTGKTTGGPSFPKFLVPLRDRAAEWADLRPEELVEAFVQEYPVGATIGWHRDAPAFGKVLGISLLSDCDFRLRLSIGNKWERVKFLCERRSIYLLDGLSRTHWQHSVSPVKDTRYSITFRTLRK